MAKAKTTETIETTEGPIEDYDQVITLCPDDAEACFQKGQNLQSSGNYDDAISAYDDAISLNPAYAHSLLIHSDKNKNNIFHIVARHKSTKKAYSFFNQNLFYHSDIQSATKSAINAYNDSENTPIGILYQRISQAEKPAFFDFCTLPNIASVLNPNLYLNRYEGYIDIMPETLPLVEVRGMNLLHLASKMDSGTRGKSAPSVKKLINAFPKLDKKTPSLNTKYYMQSPQTIAGKTIFAEDDDESEDFSSAASDYAYTAFIDDNIMLDDASLTEQQEVERGINSPLGELILSYKPKYVIAHFHGYPFFKEKFTHEERRTFGTSPEHNKKHLHSDASYRLAGVANNVVLTESADVLLTNLSKKIGDVFIANLSEDKLYKATQDYVNTFCSNPSKFMAKAKNALNSTLKTDYINGYPSYTLDDSPISSVSKTAEHAFKFAIAHFEQDKTKVIDPHYDEHGVPKHRLAGTIFITLHTLEEYNAEQNKLDVVHLTKSKSILPHPHYRYQLEVAFPGGVTEGKIAAVLPIVFPNLSTKHKTKANNSKFYNKMFTNKILNGAAKEHEGNGSPAKYREYIKKHMDKEYVQKYCANKPAYDGGLVNKMKEAYVEMAIMLAQRKAQEQGAILVYVDARGNIKPYSFIPDSGALKSPFSKISSQINDTTKCNTPLKDINDKGWRFHTKSSESHAANKDIKTTAKGKVIKNLASSFGAVKKELDTTWYDYLSIKDSLVKAGVSSIFLEAATTNKELKASLRKVGEENANYIIPLNVSAINGSFAEANHWVGLYITTTTDRGITTVQFVNPMGLAINSDLKCYIQKQTGITPSDETKGIGVQFTYLAEEGRILKGNCNDCGPMLVMLMSQLAASGAITARSLNEDESIELGQELRLKYRYDNLPDMARLSLSESDIKDSNTAEDVLQNLSEQIDHLNLNSVYDVVAEEAVVCAGLSDHHPL